MNAPVIDFDTERQQAFCETGGLRLRVFDSPAAVKQIWQRLDTSGIGTVFQSYNWCNTWLNRFGKLKRITPCIVVAENEFGDVAFLMPLQKRIAKGVTIIEALTAPHAGYACALFNPAFISSSATFWFANHFEQLVNVLPAHDIFHLVDLPSTVAGYSNPLLQARSFSAANQCHLLELDSDYQTLYERRRSLDSRKSIRKRDVKLEALPALKFGLPSDANERIETLRHMFHQQESRLAESGVRNVFDEEERLFFYDLAKLETPDGAFLRPYRLSVDGEIQAVILGIVRNDYFIALISSMAGGKLQRFSPGDYVLRMTIRTLCEEGFKVLDFASGDTAYKYHWSDRKVQLHFIVRANSFKGMVPATYCLFREKLKRLAKSTPVVNGVLFKIRKVLMGKRSHS